MNTGDIFKVAIYLRLSREDDDYEIESASISNQRNYIMDYIKKHDNFIIVDEDRNQLRGDSLVFSYFQQKLADQYRLEKEFTPDGSVKIFKNNLISEK